MLCDGIHPLFNISPISYLSDIGDLDLPNTSLSSMRKALESAADSLLAQNKHMIWLGGDHSVTLSLLRSYYKYYGNIICSHVRR